VQHIDKIFKLHNLLKQRRTPISGAALDQTLECNKSTRYRLLQHLRQDLNAPVICDRAAGGYSYDRDDPRYPFELPGLWFNAQELQALIACQHLLADLTPGLFGDEIGQLRQHLETLLTRNPQLSLPKLECIKILGQAYRSRNDALFSRLAEALFQQKQLKIRYHARSDDQISVRTVSPLGLVLYKDNWYLDAYCHLRQQPRSFALDRIQQADIGSIAAHTIAPEQLHRHFGAAYGIFAGAPQHTAVLNFSARAARWVADEHWHSDQQSQWLGDGRYQLSIPFNRHEELLMDILKFGPQVEVVEPEFLRDLLKQTARQMVAVYG
jgi:proteasome accessory factor C